ncbi:MAG: CcoQ/FixQ family Cbb3-type cytochrome c oxidase assembly chaperone [Chitinophagia bacterium]|nr:CcoQ/FixQ family Cbb3-type cytochrome c oxidase assembly chaperone [Chitinophagia bacterium]
MKFIHYLETITGIGIFPLTSLAMFFVFFTAVATWALKADKTYIKSMKFIPFPDQENQ